MNKKKLCCFVVPYFGKLPENISVFLESCYRNPDYNWIIFTDDKTVLKVPKNVTIYYCTFESICNRIQSNFEFPISITRPQKLCDFKPAYGYIFERELHDFLYWGYCDLDQVFGNLSHFIPKNIIANYDKMFSLGHMTIFRNTPEINEIFLDEHFSKSYGDYRSIFMNSNNCCFDEWPRNSININVLSQYKNIKVDYDWLMADIVPYKSRFIESCLKVNNEKDINWYIGEKNVVVLYESGCTYICYLKNKKLIKKEVLYVHIQKRKISLKKYDSSYKSFIIMPNKIVSYKKISEKKIVTCLIKSNIYGFLHFDEINHYLINRLKLWNHRLKKYILRDC